MQAGSSSSKGKIRKSRSKSRSSRPKSRSKSKSMSKSRPRSRSILKKRSTLVNMEVEVKTVPDPLTLKQRKKAFKRSLKKDYNIDSKSEISPTCIAHESAMISNLDSEDISAESLYEQGQAIVDVFSRQDLATDDFIHKLRHYF